MTELGLPVLFALFLWWSSTGLVLMLDGLPQQATRLTLTLASGVALAALAGIAWAARIDTVGAAYAAFIGAIVIWGWQELAFLTGRVTGPRKRGCAPGCSGVAHFFHAVAAILWHEIALLLLGTRDRRGVVEPAEPGGRLDLPGAVGDAHQRQAQSLPRGAQYRRGDAAAAPPLPALVFLAPAR